jgi:hypothetical protein
MLCDHRPFLALLTAALQYHQIKLLSKTLRGSIYNTSLHFQKLFDPMCWIRFIRSFVVAYLYEFITYTSIKVNIQYHNL